MRRNVVWLLDERGGLSYFAAQLIEAAIRPYWGPGYTVRLRPYRYGPGRQQTGYRVEVTASHAKSE